jgi:hypothetical protein
MHCCRRDVCVAVLLKMARLQRLGRLTRKFEFFAAAKMLRIVILVLAFLFLGHIMACLWYFIGYISLMVCQRACWQSVRCWCGVVWCGVVWCGVVWCGVVWCGVVWCGVVWCVGEPG